MPDAEVIPIGTRGRPGRGTGQKTSAASRRLAAAGKQNDSTEPPEPTELSKGAKTTKTAKTSPPAKPAKAAASAKKAKPAEPTARPATTTAKSTSKSTSKNTGRNTGRKTAGTTAKKATTKRTAKTTTATTATTAQATASPRPPQPRAKPGTRRINPLSSVEAETAETAVTGSEADLAAAAAERRPAPSSSGASGASVTPHPSATPRLPLEHLAGDLMGALTEGLREVLGADWERQAAELLAFCRRRLTGDYAVDDFGFDPEFTDRFLLSLLGPVAEKWFRVEVRGIENIPADGAALVVSNHSGTVPVDGLMTMFCIHRETGRHLRALGADLVFSLPVVSSLARRGGATLACHEDAERMLGNGELVGVWPEGFKGIGKPFSERYKLQRFGRGGFVSAAMKTGVPIVPLSVVGAEEIYPLVGNVPSLARLLGVPYLPITPLFPWLGPLGLVPLPSKWIIEFGEPIRTDDYDAGAAEDPMLVFNVTDQVRETIQQTLYRLLLERPSVFGF